MPTAIIGAKRTAIGKFGGGLAPLRAVELGGHAIGAALEEAGTDPGAIDEVVMGQVLPAGEGQITARQAAVRGGLPMTVPAVTINKVCLSGLAAIGRRQGFSLPFGEGLALDRGIAEPEIDRAGAERYAQRERQGKTPSGLSRRPAAGAAASGVGGQHAPLHLEAGRVQLALLQEAALAVALELVQLGAVDGQVVLRRVVGQSSAAPQTDEQDRCHGRAHGAQDQPKGHVARQVIG